MVSRRERERQSNPDRAPPCCGGASDTLFVGERRQSQRLPGAIRRERRAIRLSGSAFTARTGQAIQQHALSVATQQQLADRRSAAEPDHDEVRIGRLGCSDSSSADRSRPLGSGSRSRPLTLRGSAARSPIQLRTMCPPQRELRRNLASLNALQGRASLRLRGIANDNHRLSPRRQRLSWQLGVFKTGPDRKGTASSPTSGHFPGVGWFVAMHPRQVARDHPREHPPWTHRLAHVARPRRPARLHHWPCAGSGAR